MKAQKQIGQVFFATGSLPKPEADKRAFGSLPEAIAHEDANALSPFLLIELPVTKRFAPIVIYYGAEDGQPYWLLTVLDFGSEPQRLPARIYSPGPLWMRILLGLARDNYKPLVQSSTLPGTLRVWKDEPAVYGQHIDKREPNRLLGEYVFIVVRWQVWKDHELTYAEMLNDMRASGLAIKLSVEALKKRTQRLGLF